MSGLCNFSFLLAARNMFQKMIIIVFKPLIYHANQSEIFTFLLWTWLKWLSTASLKPSVAQAGHSALLPQALGVSGAISLRLITLLLIYLDGSLTGFLIQSCTLHPVNFTYCSKLYFPKLQRWRWVCLAQNPWRLSISFRITSVFLSVSFICFCELITTSGSNFISEPLHITCTKVTSTLCRWPDLLRIRIILLTTTNI